MKVLAVICAFSALLAQASAAVTPLFERNSAPVGWVKSAPAAPNAKVHFHVAIQQENLDVLEKTFWEVSNPESDNFQNFMTTEEIQSLVAPKPEKRDVVFKWLKEHGVNKYDDFIDSVEGWATVAQAEKMFGAKFYEFVNVDTGKKLIKAFGQVSIDSEVHDVIDAVHSISEFPMPKYGMRKKAPKGFKAPIENDAVIPQTIWNMYSMPTDIPSGTSSIGQAVAEWEDQMFSPDDLTAYGKSVGVNIPAVDPSRIIGTNDPSQPGDESTLDIQFIGGVNPSGTNWFWIEGDDVWLYGFAVHFMNTTTVPDVVSISYGWWEGDQCEDGIGGAECQKYGVDTVGYVNRVNTEFQKIGARGISLFVSSGDSGCHTRSDGGCDMPHTLADFPASSPYVTSVGGTEVTDPEVFFDASVAPICGDKTANYSCIKSGTEVAVDVTRSFFTSGGGFSNISKALPFAADVVGAYLKSGAKNLPPSSYFNATGRAYPDVAAIGHNGYILEGGQQSLIGGTSQSSPTFAAVAALLNDAFKQKTGKPFGYMNQILYAAYKADSTTFQDVVTGDNICTEDGCSPTCVGFSCTKGWDAVTGLGTPNYAQMLKYINSVADKVVARRSQNKMYSA